MIDLDEETLYDLATKGLTQEEMAKEVDVSIPTLSKRMAKIRDRQGILMQYRTLQSLQLTELQWKILENITDDKIQEAPLDVLVRAYKILKDKELVVEGKPSDIKGLVGYLVQLEKEEAALNMEDTDVVDVEVEGISHDIADEEYLPKL
ncbi:MAG: hypothetical protein ACXAEN_26445 [Candidatus Thorarchaeota archaeon]|jgi:transcriptional regulator with XRE-family HTH domain